MKILIDDIKLKLLLEKKKNYIGKRVAWDSVLSALSFLVSVLCASYDDMLGIPGITFKILFSILGIGFTVKVIWDIHKNAKDSYNYNDLLKDINTLNEISHDHSIIAIRDSFTEHPNRFLVYDDPQWKCKLFVNYKDNTNNESFIIDHLSRELKINESDISLTYISRKISEKVSMRDGERKVYSHKLYYAKITDFPSMMRNDSFEYDGRTYHWESINSLENDTEAMTKNADIISFVKENI